MFDPVQIPGSNMKKIDFNANIGGLNPTDSPFSVQPDQATGGFNYEYVKTGGFQKSLAPLLLNTIPDSQLLSRNFNLHITTTGVKTIIRAATSTLQTVTLSDGSTIPLTADTLAISSAVFSGDTLASSVMFTNPAAAILWFAGGGVAKPVGVYSSTKYTVNGTDAPTGLITATPASDSGTFPTIGTYYYAVAYHKASTGALSNASLDVPATILATTDQVTISLLGLTNNDTTLYDQIWIYRSIEPGVADFTAGSLIAQIPSTQTSYVDTGSSITDAQNVPRPGNTILDNSTLPASTYRAITTWKQRLVTATDSTIRLSDINKSESWPLQNTINIPSGGDIKAISIIGYNHPGGSDTDEFLVVFKDTEMWILVGDDFTTWALQFVDYVGCPQQELIAGGNGFIGWIETRGVYLWDGSGKPVYMSRLIETLFSEDGDLDKTKLIYGSGNYFKPHNQLIWYVSSYSLGTQKMILKLDLRLSLPKLTNILGEKISEGVFLIGRSSSPIYGSKTFISPITDQNRNLFMDGDDAGDIFLAFSTAEGSGDDVNFQYITPHLDCGSPTYAKRFHKVVIWVDAIGTSDITLDYWTNYRVQETEFSTITLPIPVVTTTSSYWDVALWDVALWDYSLNTVVKMEFNLQPNEGNMEGDAIRLRFSNNTSESPITINSYSLIYSEISYRSV